MDLIMTQLHEKASGLLACDVNGSDRMDVGAALRRLNYAVRASMAHTLGDAALGTLAFLWAMDNGVAAWLDRDAALTPHDRIERACNNLVSFHWWHAWLEAEGKSRSESFISMETFRAFVLLDEAMIDPAGAGMGEAPPGQAVRVRGCPPFHLPLPPSHHHHLHPPPIGYGRVSLRANPPRHGQSDKCSIPSRMGSPSSLARGEPRGRVDTPVRAGRGRAPHRRATPHYPVHPPPFRPPLHPI
jgi:hypothetical protein